MKPSQMKPGNKRPFSAQPRPNPVNRVSTKTPKPPPIAPFLCEVDVAEGLEKIVYGELLQLLGKRLKMQYKLEMQVNSGAIQFGYIGELGRLLQLQTVLTAYLICPFEIARPAALLGHENFQKLVGQLTVVRNLLPASAYRTFGISAAGSDSQVMRDLGAQLAKQLGLPQAEEDVDLLLRIRRPRFGADGWEVLIRLSPRPLSVRDWRISDMKGALNAAVARCMILLTQPTPQDKFLNLGCGSGTLLIERLLQGPAKRIIGCDVDAEALKHAQANLRTSHHFSAIELHDWDAGAVNLPDASIDALCADLPFGIAVGAHEHNLALYPAILREAARVAKPGARFVVMTQEVHLMEELVNASTDWVVVEVLSVTLRGLHPRVFVLRRRASHFLEKGENLSL